MKNWHKELQEFGSLIGAEDELDSKFGNYADNGAGITARAFDIISDAQDLSSIIGTLRDVNMDRLADRLELIQHRIIMRASPIHSIVSKELSESIAHGQHMVGGLLMLALSGKFTG